VLGGKSHWVNFKYEKMPLLCFQCGHVVHEPNGCPKGRMKWMSTAEQEKPWGPWLRVETFKWQNNLKQGSGGGFT
jgi:hypothetical protein